MSIDDVTNAITAILKQNRGGLAKLGAGWKQFEGVYDGVRYVVGVGNGHVGQFYTIPS
jgi:hypothetical protein